MSTNEILIGNAGGTRVSVADGLTRIGDMWGNKALVQIDTTNLDDVIALLTEAKTLLTKNVAR